MLVNKLYLLSDEIFHFVYVVWNTLFTQESATVFCDENVIFYADSAKIFIGFQQIVIDEIRMQPLFTPIVNKCRNEINSGFVAHYPALLKPAAAS